MTKIKNAFKTPRGNTSIGERIKEEVRAAPKDASLFSLDGVGNWALARMDTRVRAKLEKLGVDVPNDGPFTVASITESIKETSGLEIENLTKDGLLEAVDGAMAREFSSKFGLQVTSVLNPATLKEEVKAALLEKVADGSIYAYVKGPTVKIIRQIAALRQVGRPATDRKKILARVYQARWRRTHRLVWD